jgi:hypothetical protein
VAVASQAGMDDGNGGWAVLYGSETDGDYSSPLSNDTIHLAIDEDQTQDTERKHTTEQVAFFVIDPPVIRSPQFMDPLDTSGDGVVSAIDALLVINWLNGTRSDTVTMDQLDTDGNGLISPLDALLVINRLNQASPPVGEGEHIEHSRSWAHRVDWLFSSYDDDDEDDEDQEEGEELVERPPELPPF